MYNEVPNILSIGFQEHDTIEISPERKNTIDSFVKQILAVIPNIDTEEIVETIEIYKKYNIDSNEYNYIVKRLLDEYLEELIILYELLLEKDVYTKKEDRIDVIKNYYNTLEKYIMIRNYYEQITEYVAEEIEEHEELEINQQEGKRLIYSRSNVNVMKSRLISDMDDIPHEYYQEIQNLIIQFKNGSIGPKKIKKISNGNKEDKNDGHIELKDDDTRVILKHVRGNVYNVLGAFIKKGNNDTTMYKRIMNRINPEVSTDEKLSCQLELSRITEEELEELVQEKGRKNGRK